MDGKFSKASYEPLLHNDSDDEKNDNDYSKNMHDMPLAKQTLQELCNAVMNGASSAMLEIYTRLKSEKIPEGSKNKILTNMASELLKIEKKAKNRFLVGYDKKKINAGQLYNLYIYYAGGLGAEQDLTKAKVLLLLAGKWDNVDAQFEISSNYFNGRVGFPEDIIRAIGWDKKAAAHGHAPSQCNLGEYYRTKEMWNEAVKYYTDAAAQNYYVAQFRMGQFYKYGTGIKKDYTLAIQYLEQAIANSEVHNSSVLSDSDHANIIYESKTILNEIKTEITAQLSSGNEELATCIMRRDAVKELLGWNAPIDRKFYDAISGKNLSIKETIGAWIKQENPELDISTITKDDIIKWTKSPYPANQELKGAQQQHKPSLANLQRLRIAPPPASGGAQNSVVSRRLANGQTNAL